MAWELFGLICLDNHVINMQDKANKASYARVARRSEERNYMHVQAKGKVVGFYNLTWRNNRRPNARRDVDQNKERKDCGIGADPRRM